MVNQTIFPFVIPLFICASLLMTAVIAIAIWFQNIRIKFETEIVQEEKSRDKVSKMTVKPRKKQNKYSKSKKRHDDLEPRFYESPPMREEHREILKMKTMQNQKDNESECLPTTRDQLAQLAASRQVSSLAVTMPRALNTDPYIECIGGADQNSQRMTTFQDEKREAVTQVPQKYKSQAATMPRTFERDDKDGNANRKGYCQTRSPNSSLGATLPIHTFSPDKEGYGPGLTSRFRGTVPQQQLSHNTNYTNSHDGEEMYSIMEHNSEVYENTGYVEDTGEAVYGNQEVFEQENKRRSQNNAVQLPEYPRNWNSQATKYQGNDYEEELYENQEIVEQERRKNYTNTHQFELYENYVAEDMYGNC